MKTTVLALCLSLAGCVGQTGPSDHLAEPLTCRAELWDGGPAIGPHAAPDAGPVLCSESADEGDPCIVPLPTVDHPSGYGYRGTCR